MSKEEKKKKKAAAEEVPEVPETEAAVSEDAATEEAEAPQEERSASSKKVSADSQENGKKKKEKRSQTPEAERQRALNKVKRRKKLKYGALSTVITVIVVAIVVFVNVICNMLDERFHWNIDLTSSGLYEIDEQTIAYLNQLTTDVEITMLADESYFQEDSTLKLVAETMDRFKAESNGHITIKYIDPTKNPEATQQYTQYYSGNLTRGDLVVSSGELVRVLGLSTDIISTKTDFDYNTYQQTSTTSFIGEQSLISAIMGVTDLHPIKIAMIDKTAGEDLFNYYDSYCYERMRQLLEKNNYTIASVDIANDVLDTAEYDVAILCSPFNDLTEAQVQKLSDFMKNDGQYGKTMLYFGSFTQRNSLPNVESFLDTWGIEIGKALVSEGNDSAAQIVQTALGAIGGVPVLTMEDCEFNKAVDGKLPIVGAYGCPVIPKWESNSGRTTTPLLRTSDTTYLRPLDMSDEEFDVNQAEHGSYYLAVQADTTFTVDGNAVSSQLIAYGSCWFVDYVIGANAASYNNANYFISTLNTLTGKENVLTIAEKSLDTSMLTISSGQAFAIRNITVFIIPLIVALLGTFICLRRRNK